MTISGGPVMSAEEKASNSEDGKLETTQEWGFSPFTRRAASVLAMTLFVLAALYLALQLITLLLVLFLGILFAIFLRGLTNHLVDFTGMRDTWALAIVTATIVVASTAAFWLLAPAVGDEAARIGDKIPEALGELQRWLEESRLGRRVVEEVVDLDLGAFLRGELLGPLGGALFGVAGAITHGIFIIGVGIYLAYDPEVYKRGLLRMVPLAYRKRGREILDVCGFQLAWWLIGRLLAMLGVAIMVTVGLWLLGIPVPIFLGLIAGLFSFVPILGPIVSVIPAALLALLVGPEYVLWVILLYLGAQSVESYWITPVVQHRFVSLPHAMTLIAEIFAGILFGIIGITVATPLAVLIMALVNMIYVEDVLGDTTPFTELAARYGYQTSSDPSSGADEVPSDSNEAPNSSR